MFNVLKLKRLRRVLFYLAILSLIITGLLVFAMFTTDTNMLTFQIEALHERKYDSPTEDKATPPSKGQQKILIIYWTKAFHDPVPVNANPWVWPFFYAGQNCPIDCELSTDRRRAAEASALVVHVRNTHNMPPKSLKNLPWILHSNENPVLEPSIRDQSLMSQFNYSVTYRLDSDFPCPEFVKPLLDPPVAFAQKQGLVMCAMSNCEKVRTAYLERLMGFITVDSYGACMKNKKGLKELYVESAEHARRAVREIQRGYKFSLIFTNADCDYYMTEKIYNALSAGSVPVWMGTDKIDEVLQWGNLKHSVIKVKDFASPKKLAKYLRYLAGNETEYKKYLKWKYEGFQFPKEYYKSPIGQWWDGLPLYCRVCMKIAEDPKGHNGLPVGTCGGNQTRTMKKWLGTESDSILKQNKDRKTTGQN